jgi:hypothetical protein
MKKMNVTSTRGGKLTTTVKRKKRRRRKSEWAFVCPH